MSTYGQKGGESATRGRKLVKYTATTPDGTVLNKGTYFVSAQDTVMLAYRHDGKWYANSVWPADAIPEWAGAHEKLAARRKTPLD